VTGAVDMPWARGPLASAVRELLLAGVLGPLIAIYARRETSGREHLAELDGPVLFVANHASHVDTPVILQALPSAWRRRTAVAAAADYFYRVPWLARLVSLAFNTVPVRRRGEGGAANAGSDLPRLVDEGWSLVVFAEGTRSRDGVVGRLRAGAAALAVDRGLAIVPVHVAGTHALMPPGRAWMRRRGGPRSGVRHQVTVSFGPPVRPREGEHRAETMERVRLFFEASGAVTTPDHGAAVRGERARARRSS